MIDNFDDFNILEVYKKGKLMFDGKTVTPFEAPEIDPHLVKRSHETFHVAHLEATDFIKSARARARHGARRDRHDRCGLRRKDQR